jgi:hypothetical protein
VTLSMFAVSNVDSSCRNQHTAAWSSSSTAERTIYVPGTGGVPASIPDNMADISTSSVSGLDRDVGGFLASPGYPARYHPHPGNSAHAAESARDKLNAFQHAQVPVFDCRWHLVAQRLQTIRIILLDFELDVRREGVCHDRLDILGPVSSSSSSMSYPDDDDSRLDDYQYISPIANDDVTSAEVPAGAVASSLSALNHDAAEGGATGGMSAASFGNQMTTNQWRKYFSDCGALGKHVVDVVSNEAVVVFAMSQHGSGPTQRGFLLHFEGRSVEDVINFLYFV